MKTTNKAEILKKFEHKEFVQINFPKDLKDEDTIYMRSEIQNLDHFNCIYKDGKKFYVEDSTDALVRLSKRIFGQEVYDHNIWENLEFCLYLAGYDFKEAKKVYLSRY